VAKKLTHIDAFELLAASQIKLVDAILAESMEAKPSTCRAAAGGVTPKPCPRTAAKLKKAQGEESAARVDWLSALATANQKQATYIAKQNATKAAGNALAACQRGDIPDA